MYWSDTLSLWDTAYRSGTPSPSGTVCKLVESATEYKSGDTSLFLWAWACELVSGYRSAWAYASVSVCELAAAYTSVYLDKASVQVGRVDNKSAPT